VIAVIFEVWPHPGATQTYLDLAGRLGARLGEMEASSPSSGSRA